MVNKKVWKWRKAYRLKYELENWLRSNWSGMNYEERLEHLKELDWRYQTEEKAFRVAHPNRILSWY